MKFPPVFTLTQTIQQLLYDLDVLKAGYELRPVPAAQIINLRRASLLKSSLFSARIEGNPLELSDVDDIHPGNQNTRTIEVSNLVSAYEKLSDIIGQIVTPDTLKKLHSLVLRDISADAGHLRMEESAIYNQAGTAVYLPPAPQDVRMLLDELCVYVNMTKDAPAVAAGMAHIWFEKIHPFLDGNGRVGRLLSSYILKKGGYDFSGLVPFEQYLDEHRDDYYYFLGRDTQDVTEFVEFYLTALLSQARISLKTAYESGKPDKYAELLPRRAEIMRMIEDHKIVTFDFLARRFRAVAVRTLHNDLSQLTKAGLVQKMGSTRGVSYTVRNP
ncbi:MAG: Fic family protein [Candidatus Gottesmanbacteria bacterium]|nr:Fic family protein [Candidatus Gottesmanbacteria bacterium]